MTTLALVPAPEPPLAPPVSPVSLRVFDAIETALWIYDFEAGRITWANRSGLGLWDAPDPQSLAARPMAQEMSVSVRNRLSQHRDDFEAHPDREIREFWTLYPKGEPFRVRATLRRHDLPDGRIAMLVEAREEDQREPTTIRSADALLHTQVITALFDRDGAELYANPAFRGAFGPGRHRFGRDFVHLAESRPFYDGIAEIGQHRATVLVRTAEGERWHDIHAMRCRDAVTGDGAFLISAFDVTEAREHQHRLIEALEAAEAASRAKSRFLSTMSHELRTPLNGVLGMASILGSGSLTAQQQKAVALIGQSGTAMLEIIEDMLDLVALDGRAVELSRDTFDPATLVLVALEQVRAEATRKKLTLEADLGHLPPGCYAHDASRIRQVLRHMLANSVKFTDTGGVVLSVRGTVAPGGLRFEVADTGPGIPPEFRDRVFERFFQVDNSITRRHGGTGLGLAICREFVQLWGGRIGVDCGPEGGSTFWFEVPGAAA